MARAAFASADSMLSVTSTSTSSRVAKEARLTTPHLVWSARTTTRRATLMSERLVSASARFGVVSPTSASIPVHPMNSVSKCSDLIVRSATGPTSASEPLRMPPVRTTEVPSGPRLLVNRFATRSELVTMVSPGTSSRH